MAKLKISRNVRSNLKGPGWHLDKDDNGNVLFLEDAQGVPKGSFYNPRNGQQFYGLPVDPWSLEYWTRVRRLKQGIAPASLQKAWKAELAKRASENLETRNNKPQPHDLKMNPGAEEIKDLKNQVSNLEGMVKELLAKLSGVEAPGKEINGAPVVE